MRAQDKPSALRLRHEPWVWLVAPSPRAVMESSPQVIGSSSLGCLHSVFWSDRREFRLCLVTGGCRQATWSQHDGPLLCLLSDVAWSSPSQLLSGHRTACSRLCSPWQPSRPHRVAGSWPWEMALQASASLCSAGRQKSPLQVPRQRQHPSRLSPWRSGRLQGGLCSCRGQGAWFLRAGCRPL